MCHKVLVDAVRSSSNQVCTHYREGQETPKQQWMSILAAHNPISCAVMVPKI